VALVLTTLAAVVLEVVVLLKHQVDLVAVVLEQQTPQQVLLELQILAAAGAGAELLATVALVALA
jgi:hypothetical protein